MHRFANPARFLRIANAVYPWLVVVTVLLMAAGLWFALFDSPPDYQQGDSVRIMYVHVPSAWMGMFCYTAMAIMSAMALIWKHPLADLLARATAPIGAAFTFVCLVSGSLWGKPMWGAYWVWDARLTSMLILFFLYLGYMALSNAFDDPVRGQKAAAILAVAGFVNIPIIKFSVDWWHTLHQPSSFSLLAAKHSDIAPGMLVPLFLMAFACQAFYFVVLIMRARAEIAAAKIRTIRMAQVHAAGGGD
jgi:heme exporter protein C